MAFAGIKINPAKSCCGGKSYQECVDAAIFLQALLDLLYADIRPCAALDHCLGPNENPDLGGCPVCKNKQPRPYKHNIISDTFKVVTKRHWHCGHCEHYRSVHRLMNSLFLIFVHCLLVLETIGAMK